MHIAPTGNPSAERVTGWVAFLLATLLVFAGASLSAEAKPARAALVIDANTGATLYSVAADAPRYPASLTKMMTLYLVFEEIEAGKLSYETRIKISQEAAMASPSKLDLEPGEEIALIDAIKALITKSANDVAIAVAEHISGSEANFARLMTAKARELGMHATTFRNASGLPDDEQTTTARDILTLALRLQDDFPRHYPLFSTRAFTYNGETYKNHNTLLASLPGTDGIKTGYTRASGFNVVTSLKRDGKHVIGAVFGGTSAAKRNAEMRRILTRALVRASTRKTRKPAAARAVAAARPHPVLKGAPKPATRPQFATSPVEAVTEASGPPGPAIHISKVRRVMVAPRVAARQEETTEEASAAAPQPAYAPSPRQMPASGVRPPSTLDAQLETLLATGAPGPAPAHEPALAAASRPYSPGRPPSTLADQARLIAPETRASEGDAPSVPLGGFHIQVGAYGSAEDAQRQIIAVRQHAGALLDGRSPVTVPVRKGSRQLYRARFAGFDASSAAATCLELRRREIDCFVMKAE